MTQQKNIAVVCAHLPGRNTGMATVDLAAHTVLRQMFPEANVTLYAFGRNDKMGYTPEEIPFSYLNLVEHQAQFLAADVIVYWGDFIHSRSYWTYDMDSWDKGLENLSPEARAQHRQQLLDNRAKFIFLSGHDAEALKRVIVFGSTIITNEAEDVTDTVYTESFRRFFGQIGGVFFRDALSAAKVSPLRTLEPTLACDCAILLGPDELKSLSGYAPAATRKDIGVFFGRSPSKLRMLFFSRLVGKAAGLKCTWIPWFSSNAKMKAVGKLFGYNVSTHAPSPGELLTALSGYKFILTDTYHLCVNAWRMGIPAICIGEGAGGQQHSLSDKKKEILFEMYGARQFYVFLEDIRGWLKMKAEAARLAKVMQQPALAQGVADNVQQHRSMALTRLAHAVRAALAR